MNDAAQLALRMKVLAVGSRVAILQLLKKRALCVNALAAQLGLTQSAVSQHLRIMRDAGLVIDEKRGYFVHYRLNEQTLATWRNEIDQLLEPGDGKEPTGNTPCHHPGKASRPRMRRCARK